MLLMPDETSINDGSTKVIELSESSVVSMKSSIFELFDITSCDVPIAVSYTHLDVYKRQIWQRDRGTS